jgi:hypothetical protein
MRVSAPRATRRAVQARARKSYSFQNALVRLANTAEHRSWIPAADTNVSGPIMAAKKGGGPGRPAVISGWLALGNLPADRNRQAPWTLCRRFPDRFRGRERQAARRPICRPGADQKGGVGR